jgi:hypothetical protein
MISASLSATARTVLIQGRDIPKIEYSQEHTWTLISKSIGSALILGNFMTKNAKTKCTNTKYYYTTQYNSKPV